MIVDRANGYSKPDGRGAFAASWMQGRRYLTPDLAVRT